MVLFLSVRGEGKCEIDYKKKENFFFSFREFFNLFWWLVFRKKMIRKCFGGKEKK